MIGTAIGVIRRLRRALGAVLPDAWLRPPRTAHEGLVPRRPTSARIELRPDAPAESWVDWEVGRAPGPPAAERTGGRDSEQ